MSEDTKGPWDDTGDVIRKAEEENKVGTLEDLVKLCGETNDCLFYVVSEGDSVFAFSHEQLDRLAKSKPIEPDHKFELEVAHRAYNRGFADAGGDTEDGSMDDWERSMLTDLIEEVRRGDQPSGEGGPPHDAATATGMYDHD